MSNDISLPAISPVRASSVPVAERAPAADLAQATLVAPPVINPTLRLDAALGLVVIEFRNDSGAITTSIPSQRQLQAYQRWITTQFGPAPDGEEHTGAGPVSTVPSVGTIATHLGQQEKADPLR